MSETKKYWFLTSLLESSRVRVKVLSEQTLPVETVKGTIEEECDETWNVQCDKVVRSKAAVGTIFITDKLEKRASFYQAGDLYVLEPISDIPVATDEMKEAYERYKSGGVEFGESPVKPKEGATTERTRRGKSRLEKLMDNSDYNPPTVDSGFIISKEKWYLILRNALDEIPTLLIGQTGTGKTELVAKVAKAIGYELNIFDMGSMQDPIAGLLGVHRLEDGKSIFDFANFTKCIQKPKSIMLLDELSRAPLVSNNLLFPCLDFRRALPVEMAGGHDLRAIDIAEKCAFIATANLGGEYTGTQSIDRALLDRFMPIELEYLNKEDEAKLLVRRCKISETQAAQIAGIASGLRNSYNKGELSTFVSTRSTIQVASLISDGFPVISSLEVTFLPLFEGTKLEGERGTVAKAITSR